jgi:hypothetical protein
MAGWARVCGYRHRLGRAHRSARLRRPAPVVRAGPWVTVARRRADRVQAAAHTTACKKMTAPATAVGAALAIFSCGHVDRAGGRHAAGHGRRCANHPDLRTPAHLAVTEAHKQGRKRACQAENSQRPGLRRAGPPTKSRATVIARRRKGRTYQDHFARPPPGNRRRVSLLPSRPRPGTCYRPPGAAPQRRRPRHSAH